MAGSKNTIETMVVSTQYELKTDFQLFLKNSSSVEPIGPISTVIKQ